MSSKKDDCDDRNELTPGVAFLLKQIDLACNYFDGAGLSLDFKVAERVRPFVWDEANRDKREALKEKDITAFLAHLQVFQKGLVRRTFRDNPGLKTLAEVKTFMHEVWEGPDKR